MPIELQLVKEARIAEVRVFGALQDQELYDISRRIQSLFDDGTLDGTWGQIVDVSQVENFDGVSSDAVRSLANSSPWPEGALRIIVAPSDLAFGLSRMYEMMSNQKGHNLQVVRTEAEAQELVSHRNRELT